MLVLVLGGSRSGKSAFAESLAVRLGGPVTYLATAERHEVADDSEFEARIIAHQIRRPIAWRTIETGSRLTEALSDLSGTVLVDSLSTWLAAHHDFAADVHGLVEALVNRAGHTIVVSDEVGLGVHPETALGRHFRDALGTANQALAVIADHVVFAAAGRALLLQPAEDLLTCLGDQQPR